MDLHMTPFRVIDESIIDSITIFSNATYSMSIRLRFSQADDTILPSSIFIACERSLPIWVRIDLCMFG